MQDAGGVEPLVKVLSSPAGDGAQAAAGASSLGFFVNQRSITMNESGLIFISMKARIRPPNSEPQTFFFFFITLEPRGE